MKAALLEVLGEAIATFGVLGLCWVIANVIEAWRYTLRRGVVIHFRRK
jgi:hypothetical protein